MSNDRIERLQDLAQELFRESQKDKHPQTVKDALYEAGKAADDLANSLSLNAAIAATPEFERAVDELKAVNKALKESNEKIETLVQRVKLAAQLADAVDKIVKAGV